MSTTSLVVEVLVGGFVTFLWALLLLCKIYNIDYALIQESVLLYKDWSSLILFSVMALSYQLGWVMIHVSYLFTTFIIVTPLRKKVFGSSYNSYREIKNRVYFGASNELAVGIEKDRSVIRLSRTGMLNFLMLAIILVLYKLWWLAGIAFAIALFCLLQLRDVYTSLYTKIKHCHATLES